MVDDSSFGVNGRFLCQATTGVQRYARSVVASMGSMLAKVGKNVTLITPCSANDTTINGIESDGIVVKRIGRSSGHFWEQFELPNYHRGPTLNLCNTAPILGVGQVVCFHDANVFISPESYALKFRAFYRLMQPIISRRAVRITTVSAFSAKQIAEFLPVDRKSIVVLPNGHEHAVLWDPSHARFSIEKIYQRPGGPDKPFVLALGSRAPHKNIGLLSKIAPALSDLGVDLIVAGGGAGIFKPTQDTRSDNIFHMGFVTDADLAYLLDRALCLAFPSLTEGFGLPVLEAMARGCPVIASNRGSLPEICGPACILISPSELSEWLENIRLLRDSPDLRVEMSMAGKFQAKKFSWKDTAVGYLDLMR